MNTYAIYGITILVIALPLAIFEISIEKSSGWGGGWPKDRWYSRKFFPDTFIVKLLTGVLEVESPLVYHFFVFVIFLPLVFLYEYRLGVHNIPLLLASFVAVVVFEDFLWFLLNWHFDSFQQLLKGPHGSIWWYKRWVKISTQYYLPLSYFYGIPLSIMLLLLANWQ